MASTVTKPSTRKLSEIARHVIIPSGVVTTAWPGVRDQASKMGLGFDDWQESVGRVALGKRADGSFAASIGGIVLSIPRQVGKTYLIAAIIFAMCVLTPGLTVLWTAHRMKTANETFEKLIAFTRRSGIAPHVLKVTTGAGDEVIYFRNGSRIMFGARERGFGRGFDDVDVEVFDEAQILTEAAIEDMVPAMNTAANPLYFLIGTPPRPKDPGEVFAGRRRDALSGDDEDTAYVEFSADVNANEDDRKQWRKGNPSYPTRTPETSMLRMKKAMNTPGSFRREGLGIWDDDSPKSLIKAAPWLALATADAPTDGVLAVGVKFSSDGERVSVGVAIDPEDSPVYVVSTGVAPITPGAEQAAAWIADRWRSFNLVIIDGRAGAGDMRRLLVDAGVPAKRIIVLKTEDAVTAHAGFLRDVEAGTLRHGGQPGLDEQVRSAGKRTIGVNGGWGWKPVTAGKDVVALEAVTIARHGAVTAKRPRSRAGSRRGGREAVVT